MDNMPIDSDGFIFSYSNNADRKVQFFYTYNQLYERSQYTDTCGNWKQIYPDYLDISLQTNGYIVFTNGLILQWIAYPTSSALGTDTREARITLLINSSGTLIPTYPFINDTNGGLFGVVIDNIYDHGYYIKYHKIHQNGNPRMFAIHIGI